MILIGLGESYKRRIIDDFDEENIEGTKEDEQLAIKLDQNHPNPFANSTEIQYFINMSGKVRLSLYDMTGRELILLVDKFIKGGWHNMIVNGSGLTSGMYILKLESGGKAVIKRISKIN